jgi:hypothetical protein
MTPEGITDSAEFRIGLARRLAEVGLIPPDSTGVRLAALPDPVAKPEDEDRKAA